MGPGDSEYYSIPENFNLNVITPGKFKAVQVEVKALNSTVITAKDLKIPKIKDGIYCFQTEEICGKVYKKTQALLPDIECKIKSLYTQDEEVDKESISEVECFLKAVQYAAEEGNTKQAQEALNVLNVLLSNLNCNCNCE